MQFKCPSCGSTPAPGAEERAVTDWKAEAYRLENTVRLLRTELGQIGQAGRARAGESLTPDDPIPAYVCNKAEKNIPRILAAIIDSLIAQKAPDSVSGYAIMDAVLPHIVEMKATPEPAPTAPTKGKENE